MTRLPAGTATWVWRGLSRGQSENTDGLDSSALDREGASPGWSEKLGVSLFPGREGEAERAGYCVRRVHMLPSRRFLLSQRQRESWEERIAPRGCVSSHPRPWS